MGAWANAARNAKTSKEKRRAALERMELRESSAPREFAGVTSFPVKVLDAETARLIEDFKAKRVGAKE
jgi:hypothetical protein